MRYQRGVLDGLTDCRRLTFVEAQRVLGESPFKSNNALVLSSTSDRCHVR